MIRTRVNRLLSRPIVYALDHLPALERLTSAHAETRRLHIALTKLKRRGLRIATVYDIGSHRGAWTVEARRSLSEARFFLFEANPAHADALEGIGERFFTVVLSSEEKPVEFFGLETSGDSYYRELTDRYEGVAPTTRLAVTLDGMIESHDLPYPDFIKADVQGAELDILKGGRRALEHSKLVLLECPIVQYNLGAPTIDEYFHFMDERGFTVLEFLDQLWPARRMQHVDILFGNIRELEAAEALAGRDSASQKSGY